jgi:transcriptional regulator with XRE-family HTH domain
MGQHPAPVGFGRYLREAIHAAGFATPTQFARKVGTDPSVVLRWISEDQRPTIRSIERIAPVLGRTIHEMVNAAYPDSLAPTNQSPTNQSPAGQSPAAQHTPTAHQNSAHQTSHQGPPAATHPAGDIGAGGHSQPHWLGTEVGQLLGPDSPLAPAEREKLEASIEREISRYRRPVTGRLTA